MLINNLQQMRRVVEESVTATKVTDMHTHVYAPKFGELLLRGIDEMLTYHYLIAEFMRRVEMDYDLFFALSKPEQADLVWRKLFVEHTPVSEACQGVITVLRRLGLDASARDLKGHREFFHSLRPEEHVERVFDLAGVDLAVMTNDPFDEAERPVWLDQYKGDPRFRAALRLDPMLNGWSENHARLRDWGFAVDGSLSQGARREVRRFLLEWIDRMDPLYMAVSVPDTFALPEESARATLIEECVLPVARECNLPLALMIGVRRQVNPGLRLAGDSVGQASVRPVEYLAARYPANKFLVTMLARENQHELVVTARKFRNLMIFGCWWFMNNPSLVRETTQMRLEMLGTTFIPQHSDARVLDQMIYKWENARRVIADTLYERYAELHEAGWHLEQAEIERDLRDLLGGNFWRFLGR